MPASTTFRTQLLNLIFNNQAIADIGDAGGLQPSAADGDLYISLHTADPNSGDQSTSEATYTSYARVAVTRDGTGWTVATGSVENDSPVSFPTSTGGVNSITHFGIGVDPSGAGLLLISGALGVAFPVTSGVTPAFPAGSLTGSVI